MAIVPPEAVRGGLLRTRSPETASRLSRPARAQRPLQAGVDEGLQSSLAGFQAVGLEGLEGQ